MLPITSGEAGSGLVPPAVATHLLGNTGSALILIMLFMAIVSTGSAESIAVSSLVAYDIYREYINKDATGPQILLVSRVVIVVFGVSMGVLSIILNRLGLNLGWVYLYVVSNRMRLCWQHISQIVSALQVHGYRHRFCRRSLVEYDDLEKGIWNRSCHCCMVWSFPCRRILAHYRQSSLWIGHH